MCGMACFIYIIGHDFILIKDSRWGIWKWIRVNIMLASINWSTGGKSSLFENNF